MTVEFAIMFVEVKVMSIERYFLINQLMDFTILSIAARGMAAFRLRRVFAASMLSAGFALLPANCHAPPIQLCLLLLLSCCVAPPLSIGAYLLTASSVALCTVLAGTLGTMFSGGFCAKTVILAASGAVLSMAHKSVCVQRISTRPIVVVIGNMRRTASLHAIVDTGNRLHEPLSGQPVLIAEAEKLHGILPEKGFRTVRFASVGSSGEMRCFRPDSIYILANGRLRPAPEAWVALYPGRLPPGMTALAPAEYAL